MKINGIVTPEMQRAENLLQEGIQAGLDEAFSSGSLEEIFQCKF